MNTSSAGSRLIIIGGGLAGLSAGCFALRSGFQPIIVEHNGTLGGVCTAWQRGPYTIDGCIHWLTGGAFSRVYDELGILERVPLKTLEHFATYERVGMGLEIAVTRDLDALVRALTDLSPEDAAELARLRDGARTFLELAPPIDAVEVSTLRERLHGLWEARGVATTFLHFRRSIGDWARERLLSAPLRRFFTHLAPESTPALFLLMLLGYLERSYLSRPLGGTAAFRDALVEAYRSAGGELILPATVEEIVVEGGRAQGVRLADGTILRSDHVISTSSLPETVLQLLGGAYDARTTRDRLASWKLAEPIVLASFGVEQPYAQFPGLRFIDGVPPVEVGGKANECLYVRVCNDDPCFAPAGHSVVQVMLRTDYEWWATRADRYAAEKAALEEAALSALEPHFDGFRAAVRLRDVATPLTYWSTARSWRGAYEGWLPSMDAVFTHPSKTLAGLKGLYMAGQWMEPGGGVPMAVLSGRQAVQLLCADTHRAFAARRATSA
jgi:phytoene dehydrogenase-like protein